MIEKTEAGAASTDDMLISTLRSCGFFVRQVGLLEGQRPQVMGTIDNAAAFFKLAVASTDAAQSNAVAQQEGGAKQTDLAKRLLFKANDTDGHQVSILTADLIAICCEANRYYTGMMNWKANAETKDAALAQRAASQPDSRRNNLTAATNDVLDERQRQIIAEGWTPEHDDKHYAGDMAVAASCYAWAGCAHAENDVQSKRLPLDWPWSAAWWKPKDKRSNLVRAGALILAEIERLDRLAAHDQQERNP